MGRTYSPSWCEHNVGAPTFIFRAHLRHLSLTCYNLPDRWQFRRAFTCFLPELVFLAHVSWADRERSGVLLVVSVSLSACLFQCVLLSKRRKYLNVMRRQERMCDLYSLGVNGLVNIMWRTLHLKVGLTSYTEVICTNWEQTTTFMNSCLMLIYTTCVLKSWLWIVGFNVSVSSSEVVLGDATCSCLKDDHDCRWATPSYVSDLTASFQSVQGSYNHSTL